MKIIVGLGNPEKKYEWTRHNTGFCAVERLADREKLTFMGAEHKALTAKGVIGGEKVILAKPLTYMNLSGESVGELVRYYHIDPEKDLMVIYDDLDLPLGKLRLRKGGSAGTHNGMRNIVQHLGTEAFPRLRLGIGEKPPVMDTADYVLSHYTREEIPTVCDGIDEACGAVVLWITQGIDAAMNRFNRK